MSQASPYDASVRRLRHLAQDRHCTVANKTRRPEDLTEQEPDIPQDGSCEHNDRLLGLDGYADMVATIKFEAEWAEKNAREAITLLREGRQKYETPDGLLCVMDRAILIFSTSLEAIKACRKAVE